MDEEQNYRADQQYTSKMEDEKTVGKEETKPGDEETTNCSSPLLEPLPLHSL